MLDSNYQNKSCGFGEDLVAYLYGEIRESEKTKFEKHLNACQACEKELAAFGFVRTSINDWKSEEFAGLVSPKIEIEYGKIENTTQTVSTESSGWWSDFTRLFTGFPTWANAAAAFAVLAIFAVFAIVAFNYSAQQEIVVTPDLKDVQQPSIVEEFEVPAQNEEIAVNKESEEETQIEPILEKESYKPEIVSKTDIEKKPRKQRVVKKQNSTIAKNKKRENKIIEIKKPNDEMTADNTNKAKYSNNFNEQDVPKLSNFVEEDVEIEDETDSIRLTDLFDEVGGDK